MPSITCAYCGTWLPHLPALNRCPQCGGGFQANMVKREKPIIMNGGLPWPEVPGHPEYYSSARVIEPSELGFQSSFHMKSLRLDWGSR